jgi:hypothetical protein
MGTCYLEKNYKGLDEPDQNSMPRSRWKKLEKSRQVMRDTLKFNSTKRTDVLVSLA